jgi:hypothetical protein
VIKNVVHAELIFQRRIDYQFAVGAGYCISDALMVQLEDYLRYSTYTAGKWA